MNKALLTYISLMIACVVVVAAFITATNYIQLGIAAGLYLLLAIFVYIALKRSPDDSTSSQKSYEQSAIQADSVGVSDFDKRTFLKLVGGAGLFLFLFS